MTDEFIDPIYICPYCGEVNEPPNEEMATLFGLSEPRCCDYNMLKVERNHLFDMVKGVEKLKENLESEILKGAM